MGDKPTDCAYLLRRIELVTSAKTEKAKSIMYLLSEMGKIFVKRQIHHGSMLFYHHQLFTTKYLLYAPLRPRTRQRNRQL